MAKSTKSVKTVKVKEQKSLFDQPPYEGGFVVGRCKFDKSQMDWCKNWDGTGDQNKVINDMVCPDKINESNYLKCKWYVKGKHCRNFIDGK